MPTLIRSLCLTLCFAAGMASAEEGEKTTAPSSQTPERSIQFGMIAEPARRMHGNGIAWEHEIRVALPASYRTSNQSYPVLWALDGALDLAVNTIQEAGRSIPEMIIVSIGPPPEAMADFKFRRNWEFSPLPGTKLADYAFHGPGAKFFRENAVAADKGWNAGRISKGAQILGGAPIFLEFLVDNVRPALLREYRMSEENILWGNSGGGMFCLYTILKRSAAFEHYICGSPSVNASDYELFKMEERYATSHQDLSASLFLGAGEKEALEDYMGAWGILSSTVRMGEVLSLRRYPSLNLAVRIFPGETHGSVIPLVLEAGLRNIFVESAATRGSSTRRKAK
jgi:uncharacterized protein